MNKYLASIYTGNGPQALGHLLSSDTRPVQAHLDEALVIVMKDSEMVKAERMQYAEMLLCAGASPDVYTSAHDPLLCWSTQKEDLDTIQLLLNFGADVNATDPDGITSLHHCARLGLPIIGGILLAAGADPNIPDRDGRIALFPALLGDSWEMVDLLLIDSNVNTVNAYGETPMYTMLLHSASPLAKQALPRLIEAGTNVNAKTTTGDTALFTVAKLGAMFGINMDLLEILLSSGCQINMQDNDGYTVLHEVAGPCPEPHTIETLTYPRDVAKVLIKWGANINLRDFSGKTPLVQAILNRNIFVSEELLQANCDIRLTGVRPRHLVEFVRSAADLGITDSINYILKERQTKQPHILEQMFASLSLELEWPCPIPEDQKDVISYRQPISLPELCRYSIRGTLPAGCEFHQALESLPLPSKLRDYLALRSGSG